MLLRSCTTPITLTNLPAFGPLRCPSAVAYRGSAARRISLATALMTLALTAATALWQAPAQAARPMVTDDAGIADRGTCELETWIERPRDSTEFWFLPACGVTDNLEVTLGGTWLREDGSNEFGEVELSAKYILHDAGPDAWAYGVVAGVIHDSLAERTKEGFFAYIPASRSFGDEAVTLHANLGWVRESDTRTDRATWAVAAEVPVTDDTRWFVEAFSEDSGRPFFHTGVAHWLIPDRVQVDFTYGDRMQGGTEDRFFSVGLVLVSNAFF